MKVTFDYIEFEDGSDEHQVTVDMGKPMWADFTGTISYDEGTKLAFEALDIIEEMTGKRVLDSSSPSFDVTERDE